MKWRRSLLTSDTLITKTDTNKNEKAASRNENNFCWIYWPSLSIASFACCPSISIEAQPHHNVSQIRQPTHMIFSLLRLIQTARVSARRRAQYDWAFTFSGVVLSSRRQSRERGRWYSGSVKWVGCSLMTTDALFMWLKSDSSQLLGPMGLTEYSPVLQLGNIAIIFLKVVIATNLDCRKWHLRIY
jgi:hypothetical protein